MGEEFNKNSGISTDKRLYTKTNYTHKVPINGIIDEKVYEIGDDTNNIALTKNSFADLVSNDVYAKDFDFSNFRKIYDMIKMIIDLNE